MCKYVHIFLKLLFSVVFYKSSVGDALCWLFKAHLCIFYPVFSQNPIIHIFHTEQKNKESKKHLSNPAHPFTQKHFSNDKNLN